MKSTLIAVGVAALVLAGCQTTAEQPQRGWVRVDGRPMIGNPQLTQQLQIDQTICLGETSKAASGMQPVYWRGIGGAIQAQMIENQRTDMLTNVAKGCMAEKGYMLMTAEEAAAFRASRAQSRPRT